MLFAEISETVQLALVALATIVVNALIVLVTAVVKEYFDQRREDRLAVENQRRDAHLASEVKDVKVTLLDNTNKHDARLESIAKVGEETHRLCNSAMSEQKRLLAVTARAKADVTHDPVDIAAAELAEKQHGEHEATQTRADVQKSGDLPSSSTTLKEEIRNLGDSIPEKTAEKVVEKLKDEGVKKGG